MNVSLDTPDALARFVAASPAALVWYTTAQCGVCHALRPKLEALLARRFPRLAMATVDCAAAPELAAQQGVFAVPTVVVHLDGRETLRRSRSFSLAELESELERPYQLLFD